MHVFFSVSFSRFVCNYAALVAFFLWTITYICNYGCIILGTEIVHLFS
jgi:hypothetical protein